MTHCRMHLRTWSGWLFAFAALTPFAWAAPLTPAVQPGSPPALAKGDASEPKAELRVALSKLSAMQPLEVRFRFLNRAMHGHPIDQHGRCLWTADRRLRFDLHMRQGDLSADSTMVADGKQHWRWVEQGGKKSGQTFDLATLDRELSLMALDVLGPKEKQERFKTDLDQENGFAGMLPPLRDLVDKLDFQPAVQDTTIDLPERGPTAVRVLQGTWKPAVLAKFAPPKPANASPDAPDYAALWEKRQSMLGMPRRCTVALDRESGLPVRVEWFGPERAEGEDVLLMRQEYLSFKTVSAEQAAAQTVLTDVERQGVEWKTLSAEELRQMLSYRRQLLQQAGAIEEEQLRRALETDKAKP